MKKILLYTCGFVFMIAFSQAQTTYFTVSNDIHAPVGENSENSYTDLQDALDDAAADLIFNHHIILVSGTTGHYGYVEIKSKVTLIGAGYYPHNQHELPTSILGISCAAGSSGSKIMGITMSEVGFTGANDNITIERNRITGYGLSIPYGGTFSALTFRNNIITSINFNHSMSSAVISNNIITGTILKMASTGIDINNNIFITGSHDVFSDVGLVNIKNNIFYGPTPLGTYVSCTFSKNINVGDELFNGEEGDNMINVDPIFEEGGTVGDNFDYGNNYKLKPDSPGLGYGTDGTDVGIHGGGYPFPFDEDVVPYLYRAMPKIPQITEMIILNSPVGPSLPPDETTLNVQIKAHKQD